MEQIMYWKLCEQVHGKQDKRDLRMYHVGYEDKIMLGFWDMDINGPNTKKFSSLKELEAFVRDHYNDRD